jgi:hypothetical protein
MLCCATTGTGGLSFPQMWSRCGGGGKEVMGFMFQVNECGFITLHEYPVQVENNIDFGYVFMDRYKTKITINFALSGTGR